jgi:hypothetical protein
VNRDLTGGYPCGLPRRDRGRLAGWRGPNPGVVAGLIAFGIAFALNSAYTDHDKVVMSVGFYYMTNACGRLAGTVLSGFLYQYFGLIGCLWACAGLVLTCAALARLLPAGGQARVSFAAISGEE